MARQYRRDARGRFAGGGYQGQTGGRGSRLGAPGRTRSGGGVKMKAAGPAGTISGRNRARAGVVKPASAGPAAANDIRRTSGRGNGRQPLGLKANAIRRYEPKTSGGLQDAAERWVGKVIKDVKAETKSWKGAADISKGIMRKLGRQDAKVWNKRREKGIRGEMARIEAGQFTGRMIQGVRETIQRRAQRAAAVAARGRAVGVKAAGIYDQQLASTGPGRGGRGKNSVRPGPRNTKPRRGRRRRSQP